jgi:hypothetical protein
MMMGARSVSATAQNSHFSRGLKRLNLDKLCFSAYRNEPDRLIHLSMFYKDTFTHRCDSLHMDPRKHLPCQMRTDFNAYFSVSETEPK